MPFLDGYSLIRKVRQHPPFRLLPVVFLTAHNETQDRIKGYQVGCDAYLPKPFELQEIGAIVRKPAGAIAADPGRLDAPGCHEYRPAAGHASPC